MEEILAADDLPLCVGDIVTRADKEIDSSYFVHDLIKGVVTEPPECYDPEDMWCVMVCFLESDSGHFIDEEKGCPVDCIVHLNEPKFDANSFLSMLGVGG